MRNEKGMQIHLINLGCARNQVDSEIMTGRLELSGHVMTDDPARAEIIIINTWYFLRRKTLEFYRYSPGILDH